MHDIRFIRDNPDAFDRALARRGLEPQAKRLIKLDERRRVAIQNIQALLTRRTTASKEIGSAKKRSEEAAAAKLVAEVAQLKNAIPALETVAKEASEQLEAELAQIPNLPLAEVPGGASAADNVEHHHFGAKRNYAFTPKQHFELGEALGQMDFETAAKLSGARFVVLKKGLARLERALGQFMLDVHTSDHGYTEVAPPLLVRDDAMFGTAQLPKFREDQFRTATVFTDRIIQLEAEISHADWFLERRRQERMEHARLYEQDSKFKEAAERDVRNAEKRCDECLAEIAAIRKNNPSASRSLWLIPTAEVPLTNLVRESIVDEAQLPLRYTACTPCFRAEAGAAGKDTRGMIRQHQFTKVELVSITTPEQSKDEHERMLSCAEEILRRLDLHYRVVTLCTGDMGFASQKTYDIEVWLPGQNMYREISSCSVCGEFQARRMNARYRTKEGRNVRHVHTLNGSGVAVGRALIAVMETYQQEDGSIAVPEALQGYMGGIKKIEKQ
jgi:seryl-tRNA synthetase